jgi:methyl-accepting chemotaxis protein
MKRYFENINLFKKLLLAPSIVMLFLLIQGVNSYLGLANLQSTMKDIVLNRFGNYQTSARIMSDLRQVHASVYKLISWANAKYDAAKLDQLGKEQIKNLEEIGTALDRMGKLPGLDAGEKKLLEKSKTDFEAYQKTGSSAITLAEADLNMATMYMGSTEDKFQTLNLTLTDLLQLEQKLSQARYESAQASYSRTLLIMFLFLAAGLIASLYCSVAIARFINTPVAAMNQAAQKIAKQDLSELVIMANSIAAGDISHKLAIQSNELKVSSHDEIGELAIAFNSIIRRLNDSGNSLGVMCDTLRDLIKEIENLSNQAVAGT